MMLISALLLAGMQTAEPLRLDAGWDGQSCTTHFAGESLTSADIEARARNWKRHHRTARVVAQADVPYRCIGVTMFALQKAGFDKVGFVTEPIPGQVHIYMPAGRCRIFVDGALVDFAKFRALAKSWHDPDPQIHFQPDPRARYQCVDRVVAMLKEANATKLGFIGNEGPAPDK